VIGEIQGQLSLSRATLSTLVGATKANFNQSPCLI
jgi:hypothetical protein